MTDDTYVVDQIATYLGTREDWSGADALEVIADLIGTVRPHPGSQRGYRAIFEAVTGRPLTAHWDAMEED
jgi:hypothetical protein